MFFRILFFSVVFCLVGCVSPLKSDCKTTRLRAVEEIQSQDELFLIAMNISLELKQRNGNFAQPCLYNETYADDVREAATKRLNNPLFLLRCAIWQNGEIFSNFMNSSKSFVHNGMCYHNHGADPEVIVYPGNIVREKAKELLCGQDVFRLLPQYIETFYLEHHSIENILLPSMKRSDQRREKLFNALNRLFTLAVGVQKDQKVLADFIVASRREGMKIWPDAMKLSLKNIDGSNQYALTEAFDAISSHPLVEQIPTTWVWDIFSKIKEPSHEKQLSMARLGYGNEKSEKIKEQINLIAQKTFTDSVWIQSYKGKLFKNYPPQDMLSNVSNASSMVQMLMDVREIDANDLSIAFSKVRSLSDLERIKEGAYLKSIREKADDLSFEMEYEKTLSDIQEIKSTIEKAIAAKQFLAKLNSSSISRQKKDKTIPIVNKWIDLGVQHLLQNAQNISKSTFTIAGFYTGMKNCEARLLYEHLYSEEEIVWSCDKNQKIERITFGSTFLAKIYKYNVKTWEQWINSFSNQIKCKFNYSELHDCRKPIGGRGTIIDVKQQIWRYQNSLKDITLTYFGEKTVNEKAPETSGFIESVFKLARGVTGGDILKEVVLEGARHWANKGWETGIGGPSGALRLEKGTVGPGGTKKIQQPSNNRHLNQTIDSLKDSLNAIDDLLN